MPISFPSEFGDVERSVLSEDQGETEQHEYRAAKGDEERLVGFPYVFGIPEISDQTPAGERGDFPEQIEEYEVSGEDQPHHRADEQRHDEVVFRLVVGMLDIAQGIDGNERGNQRGRERHEYRQRIDVHRECDPAV